MTEKEWICDCCLASDSKYDSEGDTEEEEILTGQSLRKSHNSNFEDIFDNPKPTNKQLLNAMKSMFEEIQKSVSFNGTMIEDLKSTIKRISDENKRLKKDHVTLKQRVADLENDVVQLKSSTSRDENEERLKNVVIVGLKGGRNAKEDVKKVLNQLKVDISDEQYEVKTLPSQEATKPVVLVTFAQKALRDKVLQEKKSVPLDTNICGITSEITTKIFLNEDLSKHSREIFKKARELRQHGFKYVWCRDGNIFARKVDNGPIKKILTSSQVTNLINSG